MEASKAGIVLAALALAFIGLRLFLITADSPSWLSFSEDLFTDEGPKTDYPRLLFYGKASQLFTGAFCEQCPVPFIYNFNNPLVNSAYLAAFYAFGPGLFSIRLVGIIFSIASIAFLFLLLKDVFGFRPGLFAALLLGCNFAFFAFNRVAFSENFSLFFIAASFFAMHLAFKKSKKWLALASLTLFSLAVFCRETSLIALPAIALLLLYFAREKIAQGHRLKFVASSALFLAVLNALLALGSQSAGFHQAEVLMHLPGSLFILARDLLIAPANQIFAADPIFAALGFAACLLFALESLQGKQGEEKFFKQAFALLLFTGFFTFALFTYQPARYFYLLFPALAAFAGLLFGRLFSKKPPAAAQVPKTALGKGTLLFSALFTAYALSANIVKYLFGTENFALSIAAYCISFAAILAIFFAATKLLASAKIFPGKGAGKAGMWIGCVLLGAIMISQIALFSAWVGSPKFTLFDSSRQFGEAAAKIENPVATGRWCTALAIETDVLCHRGGLGGQTKETLFSQLGINLLLLDEEEQEAYLGVYQSYKSINLVYLQEFYVGRSRIKLFLVEPV